MRATSSTRTPAAALTGAPTRGLWRLWRTRAGTSTSYSSTAASAGRSCLHTGRCALFWPLLAAIMVFSCLIAHYHCSCPSDECAGQKALDNGLYRQADRRHQAGASQTVYMPVLRRARGGAALSAWHNVRRSAQQYHAARRTARMTLRSRTSPIRTFSHTSWQQIRRDACCMQFPRCPGVACRDPAVHSVCLNMRPSVQPHPYYSYVLKTLPDAGLADHSGRSGHLEPQRRDPQVPRLHAGHHLALRARRVRRHPGGGLQPRLPAGEIPGRGLAQRQLPPLQRARQPHVGRCVRVVRLCVSKLRTSRDRKLRDAKQTARPHAAGQYDGLSLNPLEQMFVKVKEMCVAQVRASGAALSLPQRSRHPSAF